MTRKFLRNVSVGAVLALGLAACSGSDDIDTPAVVTPPTPPPVVVDPPPPAGFDVGQFGAGFEAAFNADPNSDPVDPAPSDIVAVDPSADPVDIPNP